MWLNLLLVLVSFIGLSLLAPKPKNETARASRLDDINFPHATDGAPVPLIIGTVRQKGPNTLWYGDFKSSAIIKKIKTGFFSSTKQQIGYKYYVGFQLGLGLGPGVVCSKIWIDKDEVWSGTAGPTETAISIDKPKLFGGEESGGGFVGTVRFYGGDFSTQGVNAYLATQETDVPAYRGFCHAVFEQPYIGNSAQLRAISFELSSITNQLGLSGGIEQIGDDQNPAEAIYRILTYDWAGAGLSVLKVDTASFTAAAQTLYNEGNGISLLVSSQDNAASAIKECLRQADATLYENPDTGELTLKLIRADYVIADLPVFDESNVLSLSEFTRTVWSETANEVRVTFTDGGSKYNTATAVAQNMANINAQDRVRSQTISFPGCTTSALASTLAARELGQASVPLFKARLELNREAMALRPGDAFVLSWDDYGIESVVMRIQRIDLGALTDGRVVVEAMQDAFGSGTVVFADTPSSSEVDLGRDPAEIESGVRSWFEVPYFLMQIQTEIPSPASGQAWAFGAARNAAGTQQGYSVYVDTDVSFDDPSAEVDRAPYYETAALHTAIVDTDGRSNGQVNVRVKLIDPDDFEPETMTTTQQRAGDSMFVMGDELFAYTTVTDHGDGSFTLACRRALLDTEFASHAVNDSVFFLTSANGLGATTFGGTDTIYGKFVSFTDKGEYDASGDTPITLTFDQRYDRPAPPDYPTFNGSNSPGTITTAGPHTVAWLERNRTSSTIEFEDDSTSTPEAGQTYRVEFWDDGVELTSKRQTGVSGTSTTVTLDAGTSGAGEVRIYAELGGLLSRVPASMTPTWAVP